MTKNQNPSRRWWTASALLAVGCLGVGAWAVPTGLEQWRDGQFEDLLGTSERAAVPEASLVPAQIPDDAAAQLPQTPEVGRALAEAGWRDAPGTTGGQVVDVQTGQVLYSDAATTPLAPASNMKVLTAFTLLSHHQASDRFSTTAWLSGERTVVLEAGGDTLLSPEGGDPEAVVGHAGLDDLAEQTVASLAERQITGTVPVALDASLFTGDPLNPAWAPEDVEAGHVTGVHPIALWDHHTQRPDGGEDTTHRSQNAAAEAHAAFIDALNRAGQAEGLGFEDAAVPGEAPESAENDDAAAAGSGSEATPSGDPDDLRLGRVESATVLEQARYMLEESDNVLAEVLGRNAAVAAGEEGSLEGARTAIEQTLERAGVGTDGLRIEDLCGLSMDNRVTPLTLVQTMRAAAQPPAEAQNSEDGEGAQDDAAEGSEEASSGDPALLAAALPLAGGSGTLAERFDDEPESAAVGFARAKTGTLLSVSSLTGITQTSDGRVLAYSLVLNDAEDTAAARDALDRAVAALSSL